MRRNSAVQYAFYQQRTTVVDRRIDGPGFIYQYDRGTHKAFGLDPPDYLNDILTRDLSARSDVRLNEGDILEFVQRNVVGNMFADAKRAGGRHGLSKGDRSKKPDRKAECQKGRNESEFLHQKGKVRRSKPLMPHVDPFRQ